MGTSPLDVQVDVFYLEILTIVANYEQQALSTEKEG